MDKLIARCKLAGLALIVLGAVMIGWADDAAPPAGDEPAGAPAPGPAAGS